MALDGAFNGEIGALRSLLDSAERIVALTGAGVSTESGIPDFRSPGGLWTRIKPITFQEFCGSEEARLEDWRRRFKMNADFAAATPNAGHHGLVRLADEGRLAGVVTQNIDGLHQRAGLAPELLIEIHGNATHGRCLDCRAAMSLEDIRDCIEATGASPRCGCAGLVKAAVVSFGERLPDEALRRASGLAAAADLFVVIGSSLQVQPAAALPLAARRSGAPLVIINRESTPLDGRAELIVRQPIGAVFAALYPQILNPPAAER